MSEREERRERVLWGIAIIIAAWLIVNLLGFWRQVMSGNEVQWWVAITLGVGINLIFLAEWLNTNVKAQTFQFAVPRVKRNRK